MPSAESPAIYCATAANGRLGLDTNGTFMDINGALSSHYSSPALTLITPPINPSLTQRPLKSAVTYRLVATADGVALKLVELRLKFIKAGAVEGGAMVKARDGMAPPGVGERPPHISLLAITRPRGGS